MSIQDPLPGRTLRDLADSLGARLVGDGSFRVRQVVHPSAAQAESDLALAIEPSAYAALAKTAAGAAIVTEKPAPSEEPPAGPPNYLVVQRPRYALALLLDLFDKPLHAPDGIHPTAVIDPSAQVAEFCSVGAFVYIGPRAVVGAQTVLMPHVTIGADARIGQNCRLHSGARIGERVVLGDRVILQHNASIGADGFSYATPEAGSIDTVRATGRVEAQNTRIVRINSVGTVILEDDVEVGANAAIDRGTLGVTTVRRGTKIDNLVQIGHNTTIGENCLIAGLVGISGSCRIGDRVVLAGQAGVADHITIGDDAIALAGSGIARDVAPRSVVVGSPAMPKNETFEQIAYVKRLKRMFRDLMNLTQRVDRIEKAHGEREGSET
ncbi:UDP-3-O-(3-hydroxymyristoyl)glucosamine N-acyltransferase [Rhodospirillaceae bacterium SYSU D60014]|uniref:UDP-3-O-(3-hydroxymyristoyl)glucosamine N-acyltransferase n=1 Tax=Virgifigura deserti TaxID=2268457 RepID=UPI000E672DFD